MSLAGEERTIAEDDLHLYSEPCALCEEEFRLGDKIAALPTAPEEEEEAVHIKCLQSILRVGTN